MSMKKRSKRLLSIQGTSALKVACDQGCHLFLSDRDRAIDVVVGTGILIIIILTGTKCPIGTRGEWVRRQLRPNRDGWQQCLRLLHGFRSGAAVMVIAGVTRSTFSPLRGKPFSGKPLSRVEVHQWRQLQEPIQNKPGSSGRMRIPMDVSPHQWS